MQDWRRRVWEEKEELVNKIEKLRRFRESQTFVDLADRDRYLLNQQLGVMQDYREILSERLSRFSEQQ